MYWSLRTEDAVGTLTIDHPEKSVNTLGEDSMSELEEQIETLEGQDLRGLIVRSGKDGNFVAGADIEELREVSNREDARRASRRGQKLLRRLDQLPFPTIALVNGSCLGGGFELALACDYRIASDSADVELGLPEVKLGILPGWGGTQRLPRQIGVKNAMNYLLRGNTMDPDEARNLGAVDDVVDANRLENRATEWIEEESFPNNDSWHWDNIWPVRWVILRQARKQTMAKTKGNMPSPIKIIEVVKKGLGKSLDAALEVEADGFAELAVTDECENLTRVFFLREDQKDYTVDEDAGEWEPDSVGVIGGGTMGSGIAHWVCSRDFSTVMVDIDEDAVEAGVERIEETFDKGISAGAVSEEEKQESLDRLTATTEYDELSDSDLIIEAVIENMDIKKNVFDQLEPYLDEETIVSSNTSALSLEEMAQYLDRSEAMVGLHFFNPVYQMPLIEIVEAESTGDETLHRAVEFVKGIDKVPVVVKDSPGFLVNRILGPYMNEAGNLLDEGYAIEDIDSALEQFGMPMGPLELLDEVGIDVAHHVAQYLSDSLEVSFEMADVFTEIEEDGLKGKKGGEGFYRYEDGAEEPNPDYNPTSPKSDPDNHEIIRRHVDLIIAESVRCLEDGIVDTANQLDIAMILGTGFAPFRGGPLKHADDYGLERIVAELETYREEHGDRFQVPDLLAEKADKGERLTDPVR
jgi:3-hydroxyacyl-CoA dehydrogenase/enoyl-CoA hydratase/3-hydroxybutyryl-CoA epimerase